MSTHPDSTSPSTGLDRRFLLVYVLPSLLILLVAILPLVIGFETLYFRDVFNTHLEMKWVQAEAMKDGYLPLVDGYRSGGQPHVGNPNTVALYPDNLLYLVAPVLWSLNAHFWLHWLLAPVGVFWLARRLGLEPPGAWAAGIFYAASGYLLSNLNLYNLIAGVVLIPPFAASLIALCDRKDQPRWRVVIAAVLWCLLLLAGDPMTAAVGMALALSTLWLVRPNRRALVRMAVAIAAGTLLAAPQLIEFVRILELSFRGHWGYSEAGATVSSWHPATMIEWFVPLAFGPPDLTFWGQRFYSGTQPLLYSSFPGLLALVCFGVGASRVRRRSIFWALVVAVVGLFLALGGNNPIVRWLVQLSGSNLLRLPTKFWILVALPAAFVAGAGFDRALAKGGAKLLRTTGLVFLVGYALGWVLLANSGTGAGVVSSWMPAAYDDSPLADFERLRWARLCLQSTALALAIVLTTLVRPRVFERFGPLLLALHLCLQLAYLQPLYRTDEVEPHRTLPRSLAQVPENAVVVHGASGGLFGEVPIAPGDYPSPDTRWVQRQFRTESYPYAGMTAGRRYEFHLSPEGLDSFLTRATTQAIPLLSDAGRLRLLAASGVEWLFMKRELEDSENAKLVASYDTLGDDLLLYRLLGATPPAYFVGKMIYSQTLTDALTTIASGSFDPLTEVVVAGEGEPGSGRNGSVEPLGPEAGDGVESWRWRVRAEGRGALVLQKTYLPLYRLEVDGQPRTPLVANMHRMAVVIEPGDHTVRLWVDRRPFHRALGVALLTLIGLVFYGSGYRASGRHTADGSV